ncbi:hypothetical protein HPB50_000892 [Hyalomma asiaticum]|uniref:Uncharacterized protein n=1 Tax=Hyalomma asiaticum TaxID=266040 RepID=A0ACB7SCM5_HYAAI|nr:hypothetical protein HPB50_000892 [Hyalomma asiaticum]
MVVSRGPFQFPVPRLGPRPAGPHLGASSNGRRLSSKHDIRVSWREQLASRPVDSCAPCRYPAQVERPQLRSLHPFFAEKCWPPSRATHTVCRHIRV